MLAVAPLFQHPELQATVRTWLLAEWPGWYDAGGPGDVFADVDAFARSENTLPIGFVVFSNGEPVGFGALKEESIPSHRHLSPWAAAGCVVPLHRGRGVGAFLLRHMVGHARAAGFPHVYCGTSTAVSLLQREGWRELETVVHAGKPLAVFQSGA